ncbi:MAG: hypothetical protein HY700_07440 [Gemmatimonadetes bacterium]|nr:hypothetical protein [Gemmatimonadota bacterium]
MHWSPLNVLLLALFGAALLIGLAALVYAAWRKDRGLSRLLGAGLSAWVGLYLTTLLIVSLASHEIVLTRGTPKHFCGFYLDCHLSVAVMNVSTASVLGSGSVAEKPRGTFFLLTVRLANDARRETLTLHRPGIWIADDLGRRFAPVAIPAIDGGAGGAASLSQPLLAGSGYPTVLVFDLPNDVARPRLLVTEGQGVWPDRLFEMFLIGDEDSLLHKKTMLEIAVSGVRDQGFH